MAELNTTANSNMNFQPDLGVVAPPVIPRTNMKHVLPEQMQQDMYAPQTDGQYPQDPAALGISPEMMHQAQQQAAKAAAKAKRTLAVIGAVIVGTVIVATKKGRNFIRKAKWVGRAHENPDKTVTSLTGDRGLKKYTEKIKEIITPDDNPAKKAKNNPIKQRLLQKRDIKPVEIRIQNETEAKEALEHINEVAKEFSHAKLGTPVVKIKFSDKVELNRAQIMQKLKKGEDLTDELKHIESVEMKFDHKKKGFGVEYDPEIFEVKDAKGIDSKIAGKWQDFKDLFK